MNTQRGFDLFQDSLFTTEERDELDRINEQTTDDDRAAVRDLAGK